jgi:hypothetical protein
MEVLLLSVETYLAAVHASFAAKARRKGGANVEASKTRKSLGGIVFAVCSSLLHLSCYIFMCGPFSLLTTMRNFRQKKRIQLHILIPAPP